MTTLKILTLNCWGIPIPILCKNRHDRMVSIGEELSKKDYDLVILQEIWLSCDYKILCEKTKHVLPYSHYFYSGLIGSGCCVFSKFPIGETMFSRYSLNGFAHKIHHGDWFAGKGVGLCKIVVKGFKVNLYATHIHAEYCQSCDEYFTHRLAQCIELSQFIRSTSETCDVVILAGDLNTKPSDLSYQILLNNGNLLDSWTEKKITTGNKKGNTCDLPTNCYTSKSNKREYPEGQRIDYIMFRANPGRKICVEEAVVTMGRIPGKVYNYSDHNAVEATFTVEKSSETKNPTNEYHSESQRNSNLLEAIEIIDRGLQQSVSDGSFFQFQSLVLLILLYLLSQSAYDTEACIFSVLTLAKLILAIAFAFCLWTGVVVKKIDHNNFTGIKLNLINLINSSKFKKDN